MNIYRKQLLFSTLILMAGFVLLPFTLAQEITYIPKLSISGEYNDNIAFTRMDEKDDFIFNITPALEINYGSQLVDIYSLAAIRFRQYVSEDDFDREDYYLTLRGEYRMTERFQFRAGGYYLQDYSQESQVIDIIDSSTDETPVDDPDIVDKGVESFLSERKRYNAFLGVNYQLNEISDLDMRYRYFKSDYDFEGNTDYELDDIRLGYMRSLPGQKDQVGTRLSYSRRTSDVSDSDSYGIGLVWQHIFTETVRLYTDIGARYTEQTFDDTGKKEDNWNWTADIRLRKRGETSVFDIGFNQNQNIESSGRLVNVSRLYWDARQNLSERFAVECGGDFYITRDDDDSISDREIVFFDIVPELKYLLTENHSVSLAYGYTIEHDRTLDSDRDTERHRIWIMFEFGFPYKW
jgi:hypothetical protein